MVIKDYYKILEFNTNRVDVDQIKSAYRELAKKYHPDLNVGNPRAAERFKDILEAYRTLTNQNDRKKYDRLWNANIKSRVSYKNNGQEQYEEGNNTFFSILFGETDKKEQTSGRKNAAKGDNVETEISINVEEAFRGVEKKIIIKKDDGNIKNVSVKIPAGIKNNEKIKLAKLGKKGHDGGANGDLFIKINIEDNSNFRLVGQDVFTDVKITPWEAALGTRINLNGLNEVLNLHIPAGAQSKEKIVIENKGYITGEETRGNLIAEIQVALPKRLSDKEKQLFQELKEVSKFNPRINM